MLHSAQSSVHDEMGEISTQYDLTEHVKHARESVSGVNLAQALQQFSDLAQSPDPDELRDEARRFVEQNPLTSMMQSILVDEDGKVIAKSPGIRGNADDSDLALRHLIVRNEDLRRQADVKGLNRACKTTHPNRTPNRPLRPPSHVDMTPFVPADRVDLVNTGLMRFFGGDFFSALHILVPQLEHSLRHI